MQADFNRGLTLLVVDDQTDNLIVLQQVIAEYLPGSTVITATKAEEVLALAGRVMIDGALIDLQMPAMDGIEMCRQLKSVEATAHIPVILITSHTPDAATRARGLEAGADDFINRPINNQELVARIKVMLRIKLAEDRLRDVNSRLRELVEERTHELVEAMQHQAELARQVLIAQEQERTRISRELHDGLGQLLAALHLELDVLKLHPEQVQQAPSAPLDRSIQIVEQAATEVRQICKGLRPPQLEELGLEGALRQLASAFEMQLGIPTALRVQIDDQQLPVPPDAALCAYRVLQEALHNIERHAAARRVRISLQLDKHRLELTITDDGKGFAPNTLSTTRGNGLAGMRDRTKLVKGHIEIASRPNEGTRIALQLPLSPAELRREGANTPLDLRWPPA